MRKKISFHTLVAILLLATAAQADTIRLKNGSVIKGKVTSFADDQFVVMLDSGSGRSMSKAMIYIADIAKIDFEAATGGSTDSTVQSSTVSTPPEDNTVRNTTPVKETVKEPVKEAPPVNPSLSSNKGNAKNKPKSEPKSEVLDPQPVKEPDTTPSTASEPAEIRKPLGPNARTVNVEVAAKRDWTSSGVIVKRGDRLRITATGNITVDPSGQSTGPEGIDLADSRKLMSEKPTGGLIGVIGADNDDFVFIGKFTEFTATRDGLLFLSVNEGTLSDNSGSFKAVIEIQAQRPATR